MEKDYECVDALQQILEDNRGKAFEEAGQQIVDYLQNIDINEATEKGFTPLFRAAALNNWEVSRVLLYYGANPNSYSIYSQTPLFCAVEKGNIKIIEDLVHYGADVNFQDHKGLTPLMYSSGSGNIEVTNYLVKQGANVNIQDNTGTTALLYAIKNILKDGCKDTARCLINNGADLDLENNFGVSANHLKKSANAEYYKLSQKEQKNEVKTLPHSYEEVKKLGSTKFRDMVASSRKKRKEIGR